MLKKSLISLLMLFSVIFPNSSFSAIVSYDFTGHITEISSDLSPIIPFTEGQFFTGRFSYETEGDGFLTDGCTELTWNINGNIFGISQGESWVNDGSQDFFVISGYGDGSDTSIPLPSGWSLDIPPFIGDPPWYSSFKYGIGLFDSTGSVFSGNSMPDSLSLNDFDTAEIYFVLFDGILETPLGSVAIDDYNAGTSGPYNPIMGEIQTMTLVNTVPIPGAVWLLGSCLLGVTGIRRFRKS